MVSQILMSSQSPFPGGPHCSPPFTLDMLRHFAGTTSVEKYCSDLSSSCRMLSFTRIEAGIWYPCLPLAARCFGFGRLIPDGFLDLLPACMGLSCRKIFGLADHSLLVWRNDRKHHQTHRVSTNEIPRPEDFLSVMRLERLLSQFAGTHIVGFLQKKDSTPCATDQSFSG